MGRRLGVHDEKTLLKIPRIVELQIEGKSVREIAESMGITVDMVKNALYTQECEEYKKQIYEATALRLINKIDEFYESDDPHDRRAALMAHTRLAVGSQTKRVESKSLNVEMRLQGTIEVRQLLDRMPPDIQEKIIEAMKSTPPSEDPHPDSPERSEIVLDEDDFSVEPSSEKTDSVDPQLDS